MSAGLDYLSATKVEAELNRRMAQTRDDPRVRDVVGSVKQFASEVMDRATGEVKDAAETIEDKLDDTADRVSANEHRGFTALTNRNSCAVCQGASGLANNPVGS